MEPDGQTKFCSVLDDRQQGRVVERESAHRSEDLHSDGAWQAEAAFDLCMTRVGIVEWQGGDEGGKSSGIRRHNRGQFLIGHPGQLRRPGRPGERFHRGRGKAQHLAVAGKCVHQRAPVLHSRHGRNGCGPLKHQRQSSLAGSHHRLEVWRRQVMAEHVESLLPRGCVLADVLQRLKVHVAHGTVRVLEISAAIWRARRSLPGSFGCTSPGGNDVATVGWRQA